MLGDATVEAALADPETAPVSGAVRATLKLLEKVTRDHESLTAADMRAVLDEGVTRAQIEDALHVAFCFNVITRLADTFEFHVGPPAAFEKSAQMLLSRGYKL